MWPVSKAIGNVKNEGPELVERLADVVSQFRRL